MKTQSSSRNPRTEVSPLKEALEAVHKPAAPMPLGRRMVVWGQTKQIENDPHFRDAAEVLKLVKGHINTVEEERKRLTKPLDEVKSHLMANAKVVMGPALELEKHIKELLSAYEEKKRAQELAEAEARAKRVEKDSPQTAAEIRDQAAIAVVTPEVAGLSFRQVRKAKVTDLAALVGAVATGNAPIECIVPNEKYLNALAKVSKGDSPWAGVEFYAEQSVASGSYSGGAK